MNPKKSLTQGPLREKEENIKSEAVQHLRAHEAQCQVKVEAYQRILDANLRQSMATKDNELTLSRNQAAEKENVQEERIKKLEELVMQQSLQNQKLQRTPEFVGLSTVAATSRPSGRSGYFDEDGGSVCHFFNHSRPCR